MKGLLLLDLDETLIHSEEFPRTQPSAKEFDFKVGFEKEDYWFMTKKRPFLDEFIKFAFENFDVGVWTASTDDYVTIILENIGIDINKLKCFYTRENCGMRLDYETNSYYGGFYRGQVIPVAIYVNDQGIRKQNAGASNNQNTEQSINPVLDRFLSGLYVIMGIQVNYDKYKGIYMVLNLNKREWTLNSAGAFPKVFPLNLVSG